MNFMQATHTAHVTAGRLGHRLSEFEHGVAYCKDCRADVVVGVYGFGSASTARINGPAITVRCVGSAQTKLGL